MCHSMVKLKINGPEKALIGNLFVSFRFYFMVVAGISTFLFLSLVFSISCNENQVTDASYSQGESYFVMIEFIDGKWTIKRLILNWII